LSNDIENVKKWDKYFFDICNVVATNSKCFSRKIGSILVKDKTIIGSGYNGPPRGIPQCDERWHGDKYLQKKAIESGLLNHVVKSYNSSEDFIINEWVFIDGYKSLPNEIKGKCPRQLLKAKSGEMLDICYACHSERNTLINSARLGIKTKGCKLYMNCGIPCFDCYKEILQGGIKEIIVTSMDVYDEQVHYLIDNSDLKIRLFSHLDEEIGY